MKSAKLSRRDAARAIGMGAASAVLVTGTSNAFATGVVPSQARDVSAVPKQDQTVAVPAEVSKALALVSPLTAGSPLGRWNVVQVCPVRGGAASVLLADRTGASFQLDVVARNPAGSNAPGLTEHFEVVVLNRGNGSTATHEDHGLAAMALAEVIRSNEHTLDRSDFLGIEQRAAHARDHLHEITEG